MNINVNQPLTPGQLQNLYMQGGDPASADSDLFTGNTQAYSYVQDQARRMGIDDPVAYFGAQQARSAAAAAPSLGAQLAARAIGQYAPGTVPAQLQQRDQMWNQVAAAQQQSQAQATALQGQQALSRTPLPSALNPLPPNAPDGLAAATGMNPAQMALTRRLSGVSEGQQFVGNGTPSDPDSLLRDPRFATLQTTAPAKASQIFSALTGRDLGQQTQISAARDKDQEKFGMDTAQDWIKSGRASFDAASGKWSMRQLVPDPLRPGQLTLGAGYTAPDDAQSEILHKYGPQVIPLVAQKSQLEQKKAADMAAAAAQQQRAQAAVPASVSSDPAAVGSKLGDSIGNAVMAAPGINARLGQNLLNAGGAVANNGIAAPLGYLAGVDPTTMQNYQASQDWMVNNAGRGVANLFGANNPSVPTAWAPVQGGANVHARTAALVQTPRFQALLKSDPSSASRIIQSLQNGGGLQ